MLRRVVKKIRATQPFNFLATTAVRSALSLLNRRSDFAVRHLHRVGAVRSQLPNGRELKLWSRADDWVSNQVFWQGWTGYEPETTPLFYLLATQSRATIDVGAYVGFFSLLAAHANPGSRVFAFEPLAEAYGRLRENVARNELSNVECVPMAVGRAIGDAPFFHAGAGHTAEVASDGSAAIPCSSSLSLEFMRGTSGLTDTIVPVTTLDAFLKSRDGVRVDLLKIDTETTEPDVLEGMHDRLASDHPNIFCEVLASGGTGPRLEECLFPLGYKAFHLRPEGPIHQERIAGQGQCLNYLFTRHSPAETLSLHREALRLAGLGDAEVTRP